MYSQIITFLFVLLLLYYVGMIALDIYKANNEKEPDDGKPKEDDIDISDEANAFQPIVISREGIIRPKAEKSATTEEPANSQETETPSQESESESTSGDESEKFEENAFEETPDSEEPSMASTPVDPYKAGEIPEEIFEEVIRERHAKIPGYREPVMTDPYTVDELLIELDKLADNKESALNNIICLCEEAA